MLRFSMKTKKVSFSFCAEMNFTEPELVRNIMSFVLKCTWSGSHKLFALLCLFMHTA